jgi:hypothetical protein
MLFSIEHEMDIRYSAHISESVMELRLAPQTDGHQPANTRMRDPVFNQVHSNGTPG